MAAVLDWLAPSRPDSVPGASRGAALLFGCASRLTLMAGDGRGAVLTDFAGARDRFLSAFREVPDEALRFLRPGDDYALGGLMHHISWVLVRYARVLEAISAAGFGEVRSEDPPDEVADANEKAREGLEAGQRRAALDDLHSRHARVEELIRTLPAQDFERKAPVVYGPGPEPYPTSPADVVGWLKDHYEEHVPHARELLQEWRVQAR